MSFADCKDCGEYHLNCTCEYGDNFYQKKRPSKKDPSCCVWCCKSWSTCTCDWLLVEKEVLKRCAALRKK